MTIAIPTVVVGTSFRGPAARTAISLMRPGDDVELVREANNPHDALAVACHYRGIPVGYIPRQAPRKSRLGLRRAPWLSAGLREPPVVRGPVIRKEPKLTVSWEGRS